MKHFFAPIIGCLLGIISHAASAKDLVIKDIETFAHEFVEIYTKRPLDIVDVLAENFVIKTELGDSAMGITVEFTKKEYLKDIDKLDVDEFVKGQRDFDVYDFTVKSANTGSFSMIYYDVSVRTTVWNKIDVIKKGDKLMVTFQLQEAF
ncbi:hypothetical protein [Thalassotalea agarivorans]|uniref:DUF4426 domain-containing protein n=1 Tax=Thalassotalea agarivorans TaxID=349064 RepID=A0A1H9YG87_THASX|nr:hypothetical protein [Thalassotalea agarivorans]SES67475.1 hypothetical protein SAMN05660429_00197 [Thalassotalea agarivorans]